MVNNLMKNSQSVQRNVKQQQRNGSNVLLSKQCSLSGNRAKQFLSFMALRGYEEMLEEENANADER